MAASRCLILVDLHSWRDEFIKLCFEDWQLQSTNGSGPLRCASDGNLQKVDRLLHFLQVSIKRFCANSWFEGQEIEIVEFNDRYQALYLSLNSTISIYCA